jgi:hypothetical protein
MDDTNRDGAPPRESELADAEARAKRAAEAANTMARSAADVARLTAEVRRQRREIDALRGESADLGRRLRRAEQAAASASEATPGPPARAPVEALETDELGGLMSAPFHVDAAASAAARSDPLKALAVQVAKALPEDAREVERARLIAMAFAATRGDMEAFWAARRQRTTKKASAKK